MDDEITEFWISNNYAFRFFTKHELDGFLSSLNDENGNFQKGTNIMFRHVQIKNPISKTQLIDMTNEEMKSYLEMIES
ncbi:hypothetical protein [Nitrosopumilus sp.]|uniref:hypothetical protein n=1 Tax=Nitrosopumilus sp. TaxID=2024843 RepID=UPI00260A95B1|nr:hypothetical protein [Nitrosopumilus sp.]